MALHQQGRRPEAEQLYRQILAINPRVFPALYLLGALRLEQGDSGEAARLIEQALAVRLARDSETLQEIRARLAKNRDECPLFDTDRFRKAIEAAYTQMWQRWLAGEKPSGFCVQAEG